MRVSESVGGYKFTSISEEGGAWGIIEVTRSVSRGKRGDMLPRWILVSVNGGVGGESSVRPEAGPHR